MQVCLKIFVEHFERIDTLMKEANAGNRIETDAEFFDILLQILGMAVASIDNGDVMEARELISNLGEVIYTNLKSMLNEQ